LPPTRYLRTLSFFLSLNLVCFHIQRHVSWFFKNGGSLRNFTDHHVSYLASLYPFIFVLFFCFVFEQYQSLIFLLIRTSTTNVSKSLYISREDEIEDDLKVTPGSRWLDRAWSRSTSSHQKRTAQAYAFLRDMNRSWNLPT
jgi:hypothetical protein